MPLPFTLQLIQILIPKAWRKNNPSTKEKKNILCLPFLIGSLKNSSICQDRMPTFGLTSPLYLFLWVMYNSGVNNLVPVEGNHWLLHFPVQGWLLWWYYYTESLQSSFSFVCVLFLLWHIKSLTSPGFLSNTIFLLKTEAWKLHLDCAWLTMTSTVAEIVYVYNKQMFLMRNWNKINIVEGIWECSSCCLSAVSFSLIPLLKPALSSSLYDII